MVDSEVIKEIDAIHKSANEALKLKEFDLYMDCFSDDLQYKQLDGKVIGKIQLVKDVRDYFGRIKNFSGEYNRVSYTIEKDKIVEKLVQRSKVSLRIFIFFSKNWSIEREGIYEWGRINDALKILKVEILSEKVS